MENWKELVNMGANVLYEADEGFVVVTDDGIAVRNHGGVEVAAMANGRRAHARGVDHWERFDKSQLNEQVAQNVFIAIGIIALAEELYSGMARRLQAVGGE